MNIISIENLGKAFDFKWMFKGVYAGLQQGEKVGLVGANGAGKSTLLQLIAGSLAPDEGVVARNNSIRIGFLPQQPSFPDTVTVWEAVFDQSNPNVKILKTYESCLAQGDTTSAAYQQALNQMDTLNLWAFEAQCHQILGALKIPNPDMPVSQLSGGQKRRVDLAKVLLQSADLLILDEPTNHLDLEIIEWLENYLSSAQTALLLVSHDRYFLDRVTDVIWELDEQKIFRYDGNFEHYLEKRAERIENKQTEIDKARNLFTKELDWLRRQPKARGTKAKYRVDAAHELEQKAKQKIQEKTLQIGIGTQRQGKKILEVSSLTKAFGDKQIVTDFNYVFKKGDRIGIIGKNGVGKTTFLNMLTGETTPDSGLIDKGENTVFGYYTQNQTDLPADKRVIDVAREFAEVITLANGDNISVSQFLTQFMFEPAKQYDFVGKLSGGERRRLQLLLTLVRKPNFLILDEPTNDLDIFTLAALEEFFLQFDGVLILVSHDRYFMDKLVEHIFAFEGNGQITDYPGNYTQYRTYADLKTKEQTAEEDKKKTTAAVAPPNNTAKKKLSFKEQKEYEQLGKEIEQLETEKATLVTQLNGGTLSHEQLTAASKRIGQIDSSLEEKTMRWFELSEWI